MVSRCPRPHALRWWLLALLLALATVYTGLPWFRRIIGLPSMGAARNRTGHTVFRCEYVPRSVPIALFPDYNQATFGATGST